MISQVLKAQGRTMTWLAGELDMHRVSLHRKVKEGFTEDERRRVARVLRVPEELLFPMGHTVPKDERL
jgi:hypothetical protein